MTRFKLWNFPNIINYGKHRKPIREHILNMLCILHNN